MRLGCVRNRLSRDAPMVSSAVHLRSVRREVGQESEMSEFLRSATALVENIALYATIAYFVILGIVALPYLGLRLAMWLS